jgi:hypothetical protein
VPSAQIAFKNQLAADKGISHIGKGVSRSAVLGPPVIVRAGTTTPPRSVVAALNRRRAQSSSII